MLKHLLFWPVTGPMFLAEFSLDKVEDVVREELTDDSAIKAELYELQLELELGEIDDARYVAEEQRLVQRLREVREWREYFGMGVSGGLVRVAGAEAASPDAAEPESGGMVIETLADVDVTSLSDSASRDTGVSGVTDSPADDPGVSGRANSALDDTGVAGLTDSASGDAGVSADPGPAPGADAPGGAPPSRSAPGDRPETGP